MTLRQFGEGVYARAQKDRKAAEINGGRDRDRTCDPTRVKGVLYR